jgi:hypothetical protein
MHNVPMPWQLLVLTSLPKNAFDFLKYLFFVRKRLTSSGFTIRKDETKGQGLVLPTQDVFILRNSKTFLRNNKTFLKTSK